MQINDYLKKKRSSQINELKSLLQEAKKESVLKENKGNKAKAKDYLKEAQKYINEYWTSVLIERELRTYALNEAASLVTPEDASVAFLLKNIADEHSNNEIGYFIQDQFGDMIKAVETLQSNVRDQEKGPAGAPGRSGGYGGGMSMGTAGIVREIFGKPPSSGTSSKTVSPIGRPPSGKSGATPPSPTSSNSPETFGKYMSGREKDLEKQQNLGQSNDAAMKTLEQKLPMATKFLKAFVDLFSNDEMAAKLSSPDKKGMFGGSAKEKILNGAFGSFPGLNVKILAKELDDGQTASSLQQTANKFYPEVHKLNDLETQVKGKLSQSFGSRLKNMFGFGSKTA